MSLLDKIRDMTAQPVPASTALPVSTEDLEIKLCRKAGILAAFGLSDKVIADTLFISLEQVNAIRETLEFRESCARQTMERTQRLIDLEEGWDAIEGQGVAQVMLALQHSHDPNFALRAAVFANRAQRRTPASIGRVIDATNVGNVITLTVNKNYITKITQPSGGVVDLEARRQDDIPRKMSDVSSPKRLTELLNLDTKESNEQKIMEMAETLGISLDELDEIVKNE